MDFEELKKIIAEQMGVDENTITPNTRFTEDLGADSLDVFQIIMEIEDRCNIEVPIESAEEIRTVGDAIEQIKLVCGG